MTAPIFLDADDFQTLYDALGEAIDRVEAEAIVLSELGEHSEGEAEAADAKVSAYVALRYRIHPYLLTKENE